MSAKTAQAPAEKAAGPRNAAHTCIVEVATAQAIDSNVCGVRKTVIALRRDRRTRLSKCSACTVLGKDTGYGTAIIARRQGNRRALSAEARRGHGCVAIVNSRLRIIMLATVMTYHNKSL
jgi:hypothetical protein